MAVEAQAQFVGSGRKGVFSEDFTRTRVYVCVCICDICVYTCTVYEFIYLDHGCPCTYIHIHAYVWEQRIQDAPQFGIQLFMRLQYPAPNIHMEVEKGPSKVCHCR